MPVVRHNFIKYNAILLHSFIHRDYKGLIKQKGFFLKSVVLLGKRGIFIRIRNK